MSAGSKPLSLRLLAFPVLALSASPVAVLSAPAGGGGPYLVVVPPWRDAAQIVTAAGGAPLGPTRAPLAVLAVAEGPDFAARARDAGAVVRDGRVLAAICGAL